MKKIILSLFSSMLLLIACQAAPEINRVPLPDRDDPVEPQNPQMPADCDLEVCSFNLRYYNTTDPYPWSVRKDPVIRFFSEEHPAFVGLQEIRSTQSQDISYALKDSYGYYDINRDTGKGISGGNGEGVGILYDKVRFTLVDKGFFWLSENPDKLPERNADGTYSEWHSKCRRVVTWVKVKDKSHSNQIMYFFSTHFDHVSSEARLKSSHMVLDKIQKITGVKDLTRSGTPIFLVADFNCTFDSSELAPLRAVMKDAKNTADKTEDKPTYNAFGERTGSVIDHIFYVGHIHADVYHVVTENYGVNFISDHYPIALKCSFE